MKIIAFADLHGSEKAFKKLQKKVKKEKPDYILCAGDITVFERDMDKILDKIATLGKVYMIHGNHEEAKDVRKACRKRPNIKFVHRKIVKLGKYKLIGYGGGGFSKREKDFEKFIKENKIGKDIILMTHGPPYGTKLDYLDYFGEHVGCESYTKFIKKYKPLVAISGHLHENFDKTDKIGKTKLINPGPMGEIIEP